MGRLFWAGISRLWSGWRDAPVFRQPDTVIRWQRERFRKFWTDARATPGTRGAELSRYVKLHHNFDRP